MYNKSVAMSLRKPLDLPRLLISWCLGGIKSGGGGGGRDQGGHGIFSANFVQQVL